MSISLDPDVEIEELDHEVIVRGQLDLTGEYVARQDDSAYSLRDLSPAKSIDYVETREKMGLMNLFIPSRLKYQSQETV